MSTITPRVFATRRICYDLKAYEVYANLIKKYGCPVSKVSDFIEPVDQKITTVVYFDIPVDKKEQFIKEEKGLIF